MNEPKLIDVLASEARTALTDPAGLDLPAGVDTVDFAVARLDEIINLLNPSSETRADYALTLTVLGRQLAERADTIDQKELEYGEHDAETRTAYEEAHTAISQALDLIDGAIEALA
jgi:hypothetical protein